MIKVSACLCGSSEQKARNFLKKAGYPDWLDIEIFQGKQKTNSLLNTIPQYPEVDMLRSFLQNASKWVVILGYDGNSCRWSDIAHNAPKSTIEAEFIIKEFGL